MKKILTGNATAFFMALGLSVGACADEGKIKLDIKNQNIGPALMELGEKAGVQIMFPQGLGDNSSLVAVQGEYTLSSALDQLLAGSGLQYEFLSENAIAIKRGSHSVQVKEKSKVSNESIEEMVVTAQKREQSIKDVPISIVALGAAELEDREIGDLVELGMAVPGLFVEDTGTARTVYLRGVGNFSGTPMVGLYVDEMPITSFFTQGQTDTRLYDLDRVEVLKGPQGTLYGEGAMSGTVRFITKEPRLDQFGGRASLSASYTQDGSVSQKTQGVVNAPLIEDELGLRIAATFEDSGGWVDQPAISKKDINDQKMLNLRAKALWRPSDTLDVNTTIIVHRNNAGAQSHSEDISGNFTQTFGLNTTPSWEDDYTLYNLTFTKDFDSAVLVSSTSYVEAEQLQEQAGRFFQLVPAPAQPYDYILLENKANSKALNQEVRLSSAGNSAWHWTIGTFYRDFEILSEGSSLFGLHMPGDPLPPVSSFVSDNSSESWAVFGDTSYALTDQLEVGIGLRYFEDDREFFNGTVTQQASFDSANPRFYVNYGPSDDMMVYASIAKGFRSGGFNSQGQPPYDSDTLWNYELGTKMTLLDGQLDAEFALFYSEYDGIQLSGIPPLPAPPIAITSNAGKAEIKGLDWSLTWRTIDSLSLQFNGNVVDTEVVELSVTNPTLFIGDRINFTAKYSFTASVNYDFTVADKPGFVRVDYNQRGKTVFALRSLGIFDSSGVDNILNFNFNVDLNEKVSLGIFAKNLLNDRDLIAPSSVTGFAARNRPRTVGVQFEFNFE